MAKKKKRKQGIDGEQASFQEDREIGSSQTESASPNVMSEERRFEISDSLWFWCSGILIALAAVLRFLMLGLKPLHHDEGVNGFFLTNLVRDGIYKYDPANYHGPTLYYIAFPFVKLFGLETVPIRVSVAIFGVLTVVLALFLKRYLGKTGSLFAALFLTLSPGLVFISRYFIHEIFFVFLSLAIVVSILYFIEKRRAGYFAIAWMALILLVCFLPPAIKLGSILGGESTVAVWGFRIGFILVEAVLVYLLVNFLLNWDEGRPIYLLLASASVALFFATKETAFITLGTMLLACASVWIWKGIRDGNAFKANFARILIGFHIVAVLVLLYFSDAVQDAAKWLYETFPANPYRPPENFAFYSIIFLIIAAVAAWFLFLQGFTQDSVVGFDEPERLTWRNFYGKLGTGRQQMVLIFAIIAVFLYISILFFSSFFTYADGINKAIEAYTIWTKTGNTAHTQNGTLAYLKWGMKAESPILIISLLGTLIALVKGKQRFAMFTAFWAFGLFAAYTIIPYKTPWLDLNFIMPMCLIAGYGLGELVTSRNMKLKAAAMALAVAAIALLSYQTYEQSFVRYDDGETPYVYAHTRRGFLDLMNEIDHYAEKSGKGYDATIEIVSPDYWPMTWYLLKYSHANFFGNPVDVGASEMIISKKNDQDAIALQKYSQHYKYVGVYPLRPGVNLVLLVRNDLADPDAMDISKLPEYKPVKGYTD